MSQPKQLPPQPQALEAEEHVIGAMLLSKKAITAVADSVAREDFFRESHGLIFQAALDLDERGGPVDAITLADFLEERGELEKVGGRGRINVLAAIVPDASRAAHYAGIVREMATCRGLIRLGRETARLGWERPAETSELLDTVERNLSALSRERTSADGGFERADALLQRSFDRINSLYESGSDITGAPSGFSDLDRLTSGFQPGNLVIVGARPSCGKTALALGISANLAIRSKIPVALFTLEMSKDEIMQRVMCSESSVESQRVRNGKLAAEDWARLTKACERINPAPLYVADDGQLTLADVRSRSRRLKAQVPDLGLIVVDYLQLMTSGGSAESRVQEVSQISRSLKILARELDVPILALSQLSRAVEGRHDRRPLLSDLRECFAADQEVYDARTGAWTRIDQLARGALGSGLDNTWRQRPARVEDVWPTGRKPVYRLTTRTGRELRATGNHPVLTIHGWRGLAEVVPGERIAAPRNLPAPTAPSQALSRAEVRLLGYLISCGSYGKWRSVSYTKGDPEMLAEVAKIAKERFGITGKWDHRGGTTYDLDLTAPPRGPGGNPLINWLRELGIHGQKSPEKRVPRILFGLENDLIADFLSTLWAGDGSIVRGSKGRWTFKFTSTSRGLLHDIQRLLLRLGVLSVLGSPGRNEKSTVDIATLFVGERDAQIAFAEQLRLPGQKGAKVERALREIRASEGRNAHADRLPLAVTSRVGVARREAGLSWSELGYRCQKKQMCRQDLARVSDRLGRDDLALLATSDVLWDEVVSVRPDGDAETYDLRVPSTGNLVVSDLFCHNSGSIEQDADLVIFLYRDEMYNEDSEHKGVAEVILAKQRNGPTDTVKLAFLKRYAKFGELAPGTA